MNVSATACRAECRGQRRRGGLPCEAGHCEASLTLASSSIHEQCLAKFRFDSEHCVCLGIYGEHVYTYIYISKYVYQMAWANSSGFLASSISKVRLYFNTDPYPVKVSAQSPARS
jgi:hypothetical protein